MSEGIVMVTRNQAVFGLLVLAIVCGVVAERGAAQPQPQPVVRFIVPQADCLNPACNALVWGNPPTDGAGNPLPVGAACTMAANNMWICVSDPTRNCGATAMIPNGCPGFFVVIGPNGQQIFVACFQAINRC